MIMTGNVAYESASLEGTDIEPTFLMLYCAACEREVLSARELGSNSEILDICMHCEQILDRDGDSARWVDADMLDECGYFVEGREKRDDRHGGGGCRGGSCGVQQPQ